MGCANSFLGREPAPRRFKLQLPDLASHVGRRLFNEPAQCGCVLHILRRHLPLQVKGGAAFTLHAQRALATYLCRKAKPMSAELDMLSINDLDVSISNGDLPNIFVAVQAATLELGEGLADFLATPDLLPPWLLPV